MQEDITAYFNDLGGVFSEIAVTNGRNETISFQKGIFDAVKIITSQIERGRKLVFIGNGGSASIASHMAIDFWKNGGMKAICFNDSAQLTCIGNDYGYEYVFEKPIRMFAGDGDVLVAISSSGRSQNILNAVGAAKEVSCKIITMSGFKVDNPLRNIGSDLNFYVPSLSYGIVEIAHLSLCHCMVDLIVDRKAAKLVEEAI